MFGLAPALGKDEVGYLILSLHQSGLTANRHQTLVLCVTHVTFERDTQYQ